MCLMNMSTFLCGWWEVLLVIWFSTGLWNDQIFLILLLFCKTLPVLFEPYLITWPAPVEPLQEENEDAPTKCYVLCIDSPPVRSMTFSGLPSLKLVISTALFPFVSLVCRRGHLSARPMCAGHMASIVSLSPLAKQPHPTKQKIQ